jgi:cytochrome c oxidase subunit 2
VPFTPLAIFLAASVLIVVVFAVAAGSATQAVDYAKVTRARSIFFLSLGAMLAVFLILTLPRLPYPAEASVPERIVQAVGKQYAWSLTDGPGPTLATWDQAFSPVVEVPVGTAVEFRVTTLDVNHGFSVYAPDGHLLAQTQAMPGYVNRLRVPFERAGTYTVLCLEFCGMGHHRMRGVIEVK